MLDYFLLAWKNLWRNRRRTIITLAAIAFSIMLVQALHNLSYGVYAGMVEVMDDAVGRLLETLDEEGILDNTIIIFFSDNGGWSWGASNHVHEEYKGMPQTTNAPLLGG